MSQYLITYNNTQGFDQSKIHDAVTKMVGITDWWHYLPNVYIVSTSLSAKTITDNLIPKFQGLLFLAIRLDPRDYNGVLGKDAWEWIKKKNNQLLKIKPVSKVQSPLLDFLKNPPQPKTNMQTLEDLLGGFNKKY